MKAKVVLLLIVLGLSALLNTFENHLCNDADYSEHSLSTGIARTVEDPLSSPQENGHHTNEACHFGHCMHGNRFHTEWQDSQPSPGSPARPYSPYTAKLLAGTARDSMRPPSA